MLIGELIRNGHRNLSPARFWYVMILGTFSLLILIACLVGLVILAITW